MLVPKHTSSLGVTYLAAEPLWRRVPTRDETGAALCDFMMVIPGLREKPPVQMQAVVRNIERILRHYDTIVVFADLNLRINVLWVSLRPVPGMTLELASMIHAQVPEAKLVAQRFE